ncbi:tyrosine-type recombinase/integrase [Metamycoplasma buccale]|uniref:tyrosine-type recombinase/integrase n=1 Tax=Metamycoplasma buccale TaxID=55602 RepID=UPI00398F8DC8
MVKKNLAEIAKNWIEIKKEYVKTSTYSAYWLLIKNHIIPYFGFLHQIEENHIQQFVLDTIKKGLKLKTIRDIVIILKMIIKFAVKNNYFEYREMNIKYPTEKENKNLEILSRGDEKIILNYIENNFTFKNLGIYICLLTGLRIGEVCALTWNDIDIEKGVIFVSKTLQRIYSIDDNNKNSKQTRLIIDKPKTKNSYREIPLSYELLRIIKLAMKIVNKSYYVLTNKEKPIEPRTYRNYYKRLIKKLGLSYIKFHGLRHSFATRCIESNGDYKTVSVLLGHANITTTLNLYVHPNLEQKRKLINKMFKSIK